MARQNKSPMPAGVTDVDDFEEMLLDTPEEKVERALASTEVHEPLETKDAAGPKTVVRVTHGEVHTDASMYQGGGNGQYMRKDEVKHGPGALLKLPRKQAERLVRAGVAVVVSHAG
jgi:hypothetical protein